VGLPPEIAAQLRQVAPEAEIESAGEWKGTLEGAVADDFEHGRSRTLWYLRTPEQRFEVYFADRAAPRAGSVVRLSGVRMAHRIAAAGLFTVARSRQPARSSAPPPGFRTSR